MEQGIGGWLGLPPGHAELEVPLDPRRRCGEAGGGVGAQGRAGALQPGCGAQGRTGPTGGRLDEPPETVRKKDKVLVPGAPALREISSQRHEKKAEGGWEDPRRRRPLCPSSMTDGAVGFTAQRLR